MRKFIITILHIIISLPIIALAIDTNINKVTDLFDKYIDNKQELLQNLEEQNNNAINQIKSGTHHDSIEGIGEAGVKAGELGAIKETDLDNAGRSRRASTEYQFYDENELEPDYTKPGNRLHKEDSDDIVSSTDDTMHKIGSNFMAKLNSEGFDCKTVKGSVIKEPTYYIEIKREQQKNTEYDQLFCEEPRNNYSCNDSVQLKCTTPSATPMQPKNFRSTLPINFNPYTKELTFGWNVNGVLNGGRGQVFDYSIDFNVPDKDKINQFQLMNIGWDDHVRITVNNQPIFIGPFGGDRMVFLHSPSHSFFRPYHRVILDGSGRSEPSELHGWRTASPNLDIRPYLNNGDNKIHVRVVVGGVGGIWVRFLANFKNCDAWSEDWTERCTLK